MQRGRRLPASEPVDDFGTAPSLETVVARRVAELTAYQNARYARGYADLVQETRDREGQLGDATLPLTHAVARHYFKLLAYKDEYEVARLARDPEVHQLVRAEFGPDARLSWRLHPPTLRALGLRRKLVLGSWFGGVLAMLAAFRFVRGTWIDPFGWAHVRRTERRLAREYAATVRAYLPRLTPEVHATFVEIAALPDLVRGFESVKLRSVAEYDTTRDRLLQSLEVKLTPL